MKKYIGYQKKYSMVGKKLNNIFFFNKRAPFALFKILLTKKLLTVREYNSLRSPFDGIR